MKIKYVSINEGVVKENNSRDKTEVSEVNTKKENKIHFKTILTVLLTFC